MNATTKRILITEYYDVPRLWAFRGSNIILDLD